MDGKLAGYEGSAMSVLIRMRRLLAIAVVGAMAIVLYGCQSGVSDVSQDNAFNREATEVNPDEYVLVIGDDSWGEYTPGKSDLMMLVRIDAENQQLYLVTIPRDTAYVHTDGSTIKANYAYLYDGIDGALAAASAITGVDVSQYVIVNFDGLQEIVGYFGGVDMNLPYAIEYSFYTGDYPNEAFEAGQQTLTPWRAMALSRARTGYSEYDLSEDMMRQVVDRQMLASLIQNALSNSGGVEQVMRDLYSCVETNISVEQLASWAIQYASFDEFTVYGTSGPVDGEVDEATELWLVRYDAEKWSALMAAVAAGKDPATVNAQFAGNEQSDIAPINSAVVVR